MEQNDENVDQCEAAVVVLGDIGRSPRMCNHAKMLADEGYLVKIIGFYDSEPNDVIVNHRNIRIVALSPPFDMNMLPAFVQLPIKLVINFFTLTFALLCKTSFTNLRVILMQNPPALPTMGVCCMIGKLKNAKFSIDWHNYMYSILRDKYDLTDKQVFGEDWKRSKAAIIVRTVALFERLWGRTSDNNLCVTNAMKEDLKTRWNVHATTFYDRPPVWKFKPVKLESIHDLYNRLAATEQGIVLKNDSLGENDTIITQESSNGIITNRPGRPLVLLSSTSWTADEKFEILLDALVEYDKVAKIKEIPRILMIITGKGPLKAMYLDAIEKKQLEHVDFITPWLEANDYPIILASADLGISLHTSTSGLDLPMKVVDMFGAKVPVLAKRFACIQELVKEGVNGFLFDDSHDLALKLVDIATGFPTESKTLGDLKKNMIENEFESWETMWNRSAKPGAELAYPSSASEILEKRQRARNIIAICIFIFSVLSYHVIGFFM